MMRSTASYGYASKTHPLAPLYPQPHGYLRGRDQPRLTADGVPLGWSAPNVFSQRLSVSEYQRRRTWHR